MRLRDADGSAPGRRATRKRLLPDVSTKGAQWGCVIASFYEPRGGLRTADATNFPAIFGWKRAFRIIDLMGDSPAGLDGWSLADAKRPAPRVIAVDGSAASGKSTIGRWLAEKLGYPFLDTGLMYRAVTLAARERGVDTNDLGGLSRLADSIQMEIGRWAPDSAETCSISIDGKDVTAQLRRPDVEDAVSLVSRVPGVREGLVRQQREIAGRQPMVMAGRDIGTVVLPDADLKVYLDASISERARRRHAEFSNQGRAVTEKIVLEDLRRRDQIDSEREVSPLRPAADAIVIETDGLSQEEVLRRVLELVDGAW
jgi:CMP/dCMP kinase